MWVTCVTALDSTPRATLRWCNRGIAAYLLSLLHRLLPPGDCTSNGEPTGEKKPGMSSLPLLIVDVSTPEHHPHAGGAEPPRVVCSKLTSLFFFLFLSFRGRSHSAATAIQAPDWPQQSSVFGNLDCFLSCLGALRKGCWRGRERKALRGSGPDGGVGTQARARARGGWVGG